MCPVTDCTVTPPPGALMCVEHWLQVPFELRIEIWKADKHRSSTDYPDHELAGERYQQLKKEAILSVNRQGARA